MYKSKMLGCTSLLFALACPVLATVYSPQIGGSGAPYNTTAFQSAEQSPNTTRSVSFSANGRSNWSWDVKIFKTAVTDETPAVPDARVLGTSYSLEWPGGADLDDTVDTKRFCVSTVASLFPANVTNAYQDNEGGSCVSALGSGCVDAIVEAFGRASSDGSGCRLAFADSLPQCNGSFVSNAYEVVSYDLKGAKSSSGSGNQTNGTASGLQSGDGFFYRYSAPYEASNLTLFHEEDLRLHMVIIDDSEIITPLCMRVNSTGTAKNESTGAIDTMTGAASRPALASWMVGFAGLIMLAWCW